MKWRNAIGGSLLLFFSSDEIVKVVTGFSNPTSFRGSHTVSTTTSHDFQSRCHHHPTSVSLIPPHLQRRGSSYVHPTTQLRVAATVLDHVIQIQDPLFQESARPIRSLTGLSAFLTKMGMMLFIISMCVTLPMALFPPFLLNKVGLISKMRQEQFSLRAGQFCARWLLRLIPFCYIKAIPFQDDNPEPCIWVCNHVSQLDVFMLLAADKTLRGKRKRPLKIVYVSERKQQQFNPESMDTQMCEEDSLVDHDGGLRSISLCTAMDRPRATSRLPIWIASHTYFFVFCYHSGNSWKIIRLQSSCFNNVDSFQSR